MKNFWVSLFFFFFLSFVFFFWNFKIISTSNENKSNFLRLFSFFFITTNFKWAKLNLFLPVADEILVFLLADNFNQLLNSFNLSKFSWHLFEIKSTDGHKFFSVCLYQLNLSLLTDVVAYLVNFWLFLNWKSTKIMNFENILLKNNNFKNKSNWLIFSRLSLSRALSLLLFSIRWLTRIKQLKNIRKDVVSFFWHRYNRIVFRIMSHDCFF